MDQTEQRIMEIAEELRQLRNQSNDVDRYLEEHCELVYRPYTGHPPIPVKPDYDKPVDHDL